MKLLSIINKNLKVVSRNWNYFVVLVLSPVLLVLAAGAMLNSTDINNLRIGVINENPEVEFGAGLIYMQTYYKLQDCLSNLFFESVSACIHVYKENNATQFDIYSDNTNRRVESYVKQFVLQEVSKLQAGIIERAGEVVYSEVSIIYSSISHAESELKQAYDEVVLLEKDLISYRNNLSEARRDFDNAYFTLKSLQSSSYYTKNDIETTKKNIQQFRTDYSRARSLINSVRNNLREAGEYESVNNLDLVLKDLDRVDNDLTVIENSLTTYVFILDNLNPTMEKLDSIRNLMDRIDADLYKNIERTRATKIKIQSFLFELEQGKARIERFSEGIDLEDVNIVFKNVYEIKDDPVLIAYPLLIAIIVCFTAIILSNLFISKQINHPSFLRDLIAPTKDIAFLTANYVVTLSFIFLQIFFLYLVGHLWFRIEVFNNLRYSLFLIFLVASIFVFVGMSIGYMIRSQYLSMLISIFFVIFFFIYSDILTPVVLAGPIIRFFIGINPFVLLTDGLLDLIILNNAGFVNAFLYYKLGFMFFASFVLYYISKKICNFRATA